MKNIFLVKVDTRIFGAEYKIYIILTSNIHLQGYDLIILRLTFCHLVNSEVGMLQLVQGWHAGIANSWVGAGRAGNHSREPQNKGPQGVENTRGKAETIKSNDTVWASREPKTLYTYVQRHEGGWNGICKVKISMLFRDLIWDKVPKKVFLNDFEIERNQHFVSN